MLVVWKMRTHLVACSVCCRCATCRRLIRTGDTGVCRDTRPNQESVIAIPTGERLEGDLLRAALSKKAALISCLPLAVAALVRTGALGLALASGSWGTGAATAIEVDGRFGKVGCTRASRSRAADKLDPSPLIMIC